jgi:hypothetical protein
MWIQADPDPKHCVYLQAKTNFAKLSTENSLASTLQQYDFKSEENPF